MRHPTGLLAAAAVLVLAAPASAGVDLRDTRAVGVATSDNAPLAAVGDINGDGLEGDAVGVQVDPGAADGAHTGGVGTIGLGAARLVLKNLNAPPLFKGNFGM